MATYVAYQAQYNWCPGEKENTLAPEIRVIVDNEEVVILTLSDEATVRFPGEKSRKWGELKAILERKPPFPPPFPVEVAGEGPWLCDPTEIAHDIKRLQSISKELAEKISRRNQQIKGLREGLKVD